MSEFVPVRPLSSDECNLRKFTGVRETFAKIFDGGPTFFVRVPGRVNLIGEHIDYCGYAVFPMAIEQDIVVAVGPNDTRELRLVNVNDELYREFRCDVDGYEITTPPAWHDYLLCGHKGVVESTADGGCGMNVAVSGVIPPSSGLSSSSALVCAGAIATKHALNSSGSISKIETADLCAKCERYIGTQGGGMDQAIAMLAERDSAKYIEFVPSLKATNVTLPGGANFYISHSGAELNKAATDHYNTRVFETKCAAAIIKHAEVNNNEVGREVIDDGKPLTLGYVQCLAKKSLSDMCEYLHELLDEDKLYTVAEICAMLDLETEGDLVTLLAQNSDSATNRFESVIRSNRNAGFPLLRRALHVYAEANRVGLFKAICESTATDEGKLIELGGLMNASHLSCRDLYECSHEKLDDLVEHALVSGALGSRLTGAGWGGCVVSLVQQDDCKEFESKMKGMAKFTLKSTPSSGAAIYVP